MKHLTAPELAQRIQAGLTPATLLLDVREPWEFDICKLDGAVLMPMRSIPARLGELDPHQEVICICHHGGRSMQVANFLEANGFQNVVNFTGGMHAWATQVDSAVPTY